ncbi:alpha amylase catalytic region [Bradyrhizobium oligotrophicum S58]|uniref:Alpha amylase catalytic region n=2 Tax=Bradyrhizobium oligotrophicum TaxID=44255 RepID=M4Z6J7_9BRAD|nr:alpha amylase catalytic region [Bradyrhizobium oligotrophicum S58]
MMGSWIEHAILWHVYPLGFVGAEREARARDGVVHRLGHLTSWLDYAVDLGVSGLLLGPIFASSTHGYDTIDYFRVDPRLGDDADFDAFVSAARTRGLRIILDGVFNHVGSDYPAFQRALAGGPGSPEAHWFKLTWPAARSAGELPDYATFEGHRHLVALNHDDPGVADHVVAVMRHWLSRGVSGWRLDAAYAVPRAFWSKVLPRVRADFPEAYFVGEVIHGDYAGFVRETGIDAVTQYELWKAIWSSLNDGNLFELAWALKRHDAMLETFVPQTFIGNHDVTRIASQLHDERHLAHALVVLMTSGGTPSIYAGDEQRFHGIKEHRVGGDDAIRPAFPKKPADLALFGWPTYRLHQQLIGLRRRHPWLHRARSRVITINRSDLLLETSYGADRLWVVLNLADAGIVRTIETEADRLAGDIELSHKGGATDVSVPPHGWGILGRRNEARAADADMS